MRRFFACCLPLKFTHSQDAIRTADESQPSAATFPIPTQRGGSFRGQATSAQFQNQNQLLQEQQQHGEEEQQLHHYQPANGDNRDADNAMLQPDMLPATLLAGAGSSATQPSRVLYTASPAGVYSNRGDSTAPPWRPSPARSWSQAGLLDHPSSVVDALLEGVRGLLHSDGGGGGGGASSSFTLTPNPSDAVTLLSTPPAVFTSTAPSSIATTAATGNPNAGSGALLDPPGLRASEASGGSDHHHLQHHHPTYPPGQQPSAGAGSSGGGDMMQQVLAPAAAPATEPAAASASRSGVLAAPGAAAAASPAGGLLGFPSKISTLCSSLSSYAALGPVGQRSQPAVAAAAPRRRRLSNLPRSSSRPASSASGGRISRLLTVTGVAAGLGSGGRTTSGRSSFRFSGGGAAAAPATSAGGGTDGGGCSAGGGGRGILSSSAASPSPSLSPPLLSTSPRILAAVLAAAPSRLHVRSGLVLPASVVMGLSGSRSQRRSSCPQSPTGAGSSAMVSPPPSTAMRVSDTSAPQATTAAAAAAAAAFVHAPPPQLQLAQVAAASIAASSGGAARAAISQDTTISVSPDPSPSEMGSGGVARRRRSAGSEQAAAAAGRTAAAMAVAATGGTCPRGPPGRVSRSLAEPLLPLLPPPATSEPAVVHAVTSSTCGVTALLADVMNAVQPLPLSTGGGRSSVITGVWRGLPVAVKIMCSASLTPDGAAITAVRRVGTIGHRHLAKVYGIRTAKVDQAFLWTLVPEPRRASRAFAQVLAQLDRPHATEAAALPPPPNPSRGSAAAAASSGTGDVGGEGQWRSPPPPLPLPHVRRQQQPPAKQAPAEVASAAAASAALAAASAATAPAAAAPTAPGSCRVARDAACGAGSSSGSGRHNRQRQRASPVSSPSPPPPPQRVFATRGGEGRQATRTTSPRRMALAAVRPRAGEYVAAVIMEHCEMGDLASLLSMSYNPFRPNRRWPPYMAARAVLRCAREVAAALAHLHRRGITHGGVKPTNVLLVPTRGDMRYFRVKLADPCFSGSCLDEGGPAASSSGLLYCAPEALRHGPSPAADVWAFGLLLRAMVTAPQLPFAGEPTVPLLLRIAETAYRPPWPQPGSEGPYLPLLQPLYERCTRPDPGARPTFEQIYMELRALEIRMRSGKRCGVNAGAFGTPPPLRPPPPEDVVSASASVSAPSAGPRPPSGGGGAICAGATLSFAAAAGFVPTATSAAVLGAGSGGGSGSRSSGAGEGGGILLGVRTSIFTATWSGELSESSQLPQAELQPQLQPQLQPLPQQLLPAQHQQEQQEQLQKQHSLRPQPQ